MEGFKKVRCAAHADTGCISWLDFTVYASQPKPIRNPETLLALTVYRGNKRIWSCRDHTKLTAQGIRMELVRFVEDWFIVFCREYTVLLAVPVFYLEELTWTCDQAYIGGMSVKEKMWAKYASARFLNFGIEWDDREETLLPKKMHLKRPVGHQNMLTPKEHKLKKIEILERKDITIMTAHGVKSGKPVVADEWRSLPNDQKCVLVSSYNTQTKQIGKKIEFFITWVHATLVRRRCTIEAIEY